MAIFFGGKRLMPESNNPLGGRPDPIPTAASHSVNGALKGPYTRGRRDRDVWPQLFLGAIAPGIRRARTSGLTGAGIGPLPHTVRVQAGPLALSAERPRSQNTRVSGIPTTKRPPHERMYLHDSEISLVRFHGKIKT